MKHLSDATTADGSVSNAQYRTVEQIKFASPMPTTIVAIASQQPRLVTTTAMHGSIQLRYTPRQEKATSQSTS